MLQRAAEDAVSADLVNAIVRRAARSALEGNIVATKVVLDRVCGRPPEAQADVAPPDVSLPSLNSAASCITAIDKIIAGISAGTVDLPTAKFLLDAVERRMKALEMNEYEQRLTDLERAASNVDLGKG